MSDMEGKVARVSDEEVGQKTEFQTRNQIRHFPVSLAITCRFSGSVRIRNAFRSVWVQRLPLYDQVNAVVLNEFLKQHKG
jgi:hypothetical protein